MPSINGITAAIHTHDGPVREYAVDEFSGGVSCYIPAHSGQQFWLHYSIDKPIRAKSVSVEFHVDGYRIDTQFPLAAEGTDPPAVGPVQSSITSQYGKDESGDVYRRDVFFSLVGKKPRASKHHGPAEAAALDSYGTIECKVYRAEKTGEWTGAISPEDIDSPSKRNSGTLRGKGVSHNARLGAKIDASQTTRYTFRTLDPEGLPFAWIKFHYRSAAQIQQMSEPRFTSLSLTRPSSPSSFTFRQFFFRAKDNVPERVASRAHHESPPRSRTPVRLENIESTLQRIQSDLAAAENSVDRTDEFGGLQEKLERLKESTAIFRKKSQVLRDRRKDKGTQSSRGEPRVKIKEPEGKPDDDILGDINNDGPSRRAAE